MIGQRGNNGSAAGEVPRLLDQPSSAAAYGGMASEQSLKLLKAATRYDESESRKHRIAVALSTKRVRRRPFLLKPAIAGGVLLGFGAVASAAIWHWPQRVMDSVQQLSSIPAQSIPETAAHRYARSRLKEAPPIATAPALPPTEPTPAVVSREAPGARGPAPMLTPAHRELTSRVRARRMAGEDASEVFAAMRALRRDHDPVRARSLLSTYLARHPTGALAEEALAMSIEAAVVHRDGDTTVLANRYLQLYPSGPFRTLATRALSEPR